MSARLKNRSGQVNGMATATAATKITKNMMRKFGRICGVAFLSFHAHSSENWNVLAEKDHATAEKDNADPSGRVLPTTAARQAGKDIARPALVHKVVLTGGPCGGKSTALSLIANRLQSLGFNVYLVPEAATLLWTGGARFKHWDLKKEIAFEANKIQVQFSLEDAFMSLARATGEPSIVICDRGTMDSRAYVSSDTWSMIQSEYGWSDVSLRDRQYDTVIHMVSTAIGAESFYTSENNPTRRESVEEARKLDIRILESWVGHPRLYVIDNSTDFAGKMRRVEALVCRNAGVPLPGSDFRKYLLERPDFSPAEDLCDDQGNRMHFQDFKVEQTYLARAAKSAPEEGYVFVQRRSRNGANSYLYSSKMRLDEGESAVLQRQISGMEFATLLEQRDPLRATVRKRVYCFLYKNQYFELNVYEHPTPGLMILKTDSTPGVDVELPPCFAVSRDVTNDPRFSSYEIARADSIPPPS